MGPWHDGHTRAPRGAPTTHGDCYPDDPDRAGLRAAGVVLDPTWSGPLSLRSHPISVNLACFGAVSVGLALWLGQLGDDGLAPLLAWLLAISLSTFVAFGLDKLAARRQGWRVPETALLVLAFAGGTLGALGAMSVFRHKTVKGSFRLRFFGVVGLQLALLAGWWWWRRSAGEG